MSRSTYVEQGTTGSSPNPKNHTISVGLFVVKGVMWMKREEFVERLERVRTSDVRMTEAEIKDRIHRHANLEKDMPVCIGELSELILELTRFQRGKMDRDDFLQELSHVQWTVWALQDAFGVMDGELRAAVQASFR